MLQIVSPVVFLNYSFKLISSCVFEYINTMINSPKKSLRLKNKRLLAELDLKNDADTDPPVLLTSKE